MLVSRAPDTPDGAGVQYNASVTRAHARFSFLRLLSVPRTLVDHAHAEDTERRVLRPLSIISKLFELERE